MTKVYIAGKEFTLNPNKTIGKGGEADIYDIGQGKALKLFKTPSHPDLAGNANEQLAAKQRLQIHQTKLAAFPRIKTSRVIKPELLAFAKNGKDVIGYTMTFLKGKELLTMLSQRSFRDAGYSNTMVGETFKDIHSTVREIHDNKIIIGDFNDLNVMVDLNKPEAYFLDADSWQYGQYPCCVFTQRFVDPLLCDPNASSLMLIKSHTTESDWYAFTTILFNSLLFVGPYGGIHKPKNPADKLKHDERPLRKISVFNPEVKYPKPAVKYDVLDDTLIQFFYETYEKDRREEFPIKLLDMNWKKCSACGIEYARNHCPKCTLATPVTVKQTMEIRGTVTSRTIFKTRGRIIYATYQDKLRYVYHEDNAYKRENESTLINGKDSNTIRVRISGEATHIATNGILTSLNYGYPGASHRINVDSYNNLPVYDSNYNHRIWIEGGKIYKDGPYGKISLGDVLANQTLFWIGESMGFGFYRAANLSIAFVFNPTSPGINDSVKLPVMNGQLVDSTCVFTKELAWFFATLNQSGKLINYCYVINNKGVVLASHYSDTDSNNWLSQIRGSCAAGDFLLSATDEGIVRIEMQGNSLVVAKKFPDTEPFVSSAVHLFAGRDGLFVVDRNEIRQLEIK